MKITVTLLACLILYAGSPENAYPNNFLSVTDTWKGTTTLSPEGYARYDILSGFRLQEGYFWSSPDTVDFGPVVLGACAEAFPPIGLGVQGPESVMRITGSDGYQFSLNYPGYTHFVDTLEIPVESGNYFNLNVQHCPVSMDETQGFINISAQGYETYHIVVYSQIVDQGYTLTLEANPPEAASQLNGAGTYAPGATARISAWVTPSGEEEFSEWFFYNWTEQDTVVFQQCGVSEYSFVMNSDRHLVANFVKDIPLFSFSPPALDFGAVPVGECKMLEYMAGSAYCSVVEKAYSDIEIIAPEGFQVKLYDFPFSDTLYWGFYGNFAFGETFLARFCPTEEKEYNDHITYLYPGSQPGLLQVTGTGIGSIPTLDITLILEGPYTPEADHLMQRTAPYLAPHQPFSSPLPYYGNLAPVWHYQGEEALEDNFGEGFPMELIEDIIDWVLVEQYDAASGSEITPEDLIKRQACLLMKDGTVLNPYGKPPGVSSPVEKNLYVVVYHLNHLGVITQGLEQQDGRYVADFTRPDPQAPHGLKHLGNGIYGAFAGDANADGSIEVSDTQVIEYCMVVEAFPEPADFNLDGRVTQADLQLWEDNYQQLTMVTQLSTITDGLPCEEYETVTDERDGTLYHSVRIGNQCWLTENARYLPDVYPPGDLAPAQPAWYVYDYPGNDPQEAAGSETYLAYGTLYNWMAALDACPAGWHLPDESEWAQLAQYLDENYDLENETGSIRSLGNVLKSCRQQQTLLGTGCNTETHPRWDQDDDFGMDDFGFSALPGGRLIPGGGAELLGSTAHWWSASHASDQQAAFTTLQGHALLSQQPGAQKTTALSVRCVKEMEATATLHRLVILAHPEQGGTITGRGEYPAGRNVLLQAQPAEGYHFVHWTLGEEVLSPEPYLVYQMPEGAVTLEAWFEQATGIPAAGSLQVLIYPVPAQQQLWVAFDNTGHTILTLFNIQGQAMEQRIVTSQGPTRINLPVEQMARGIYLLSVKTQKMTVVYRVVLN